MLLFKKKFLEAIRSGRKTQTIRLWPRAQFRSGQRSFIPGAGYVWIESIEQVELDELTDEDAVPDGFATADELRAEIAAIYSNPSDRSKRAFRIRFRLAPGEVKRSLTTKMPTRQQAKVPVAAEENERPKLQAKMSLPPDGFLLNQRRKI